MNLKTPGDSAPGVVVVVVVVAVVVVVGTPPTIKTTSVLLGIYSTFFM